jgi:asparagine synthase (glutamine-hydrolysing)
LEWCDGTLKTSRYWQPAAATQPIEMGEAAERLGELLKQSVGRQMVSDVPVGAFLSGGLDSTTIVALMQQASDRPIKTFSVGFGEHINELPYARAVAKKYHTEHHEIELGTPLVGEMLERMAVIFDEPFADTSNIPMYLISEFARRQVKVVLTGDGGDELFGGYSWTYPALVKSDEVARSTALWILLRSLSRLTNHRWPALSLYSAACGLAARSPDMWARQVAQHVQIRRPGRRSLWGSRAREVESFEPGGYYTPPEWVTGANRGFYFDLTSYLPGDILVKVDRAAMAHGLETRSPFLDRDLAEFALSLPVNLKVEGHATKRLLRETCSRYWPEEIKHRPKQGFGVPLKVWLARPDVRVLRERVFSSHSALVDLLPGLRERSTWRNDYQTWILLTLGLWLEKHPPSS